MCIHELLRLQSNSCRKCGGVRDGFSFEELPKEEQPHWIESGMRGSIDYFLYCPSCEEYSALFMTEEFNKKNRVTPVFLVLWIAI